MEETKKEKVVPKEKPAEEKPKVEVPKVETPKEKVVKKSILRNTSGKEVKEADYFFGGTPPAGFEGTCGKPVDREDLLAVFDKVFKPQDDILFYKQLDKEVYIIIIPIKFATTIGDFNNSLEGDFQKHAISFLNEGSVNLDSLRMKLERIQKFVKYTDR